jgi:hypothetical protein
VYAVLSENLKRRMILELREFWAKDPKYKDTLVPNIQGKYSFREQPQQAIILKNTSASPFQLSADHYQGIKVAYAQLTRVFGKQGTSIEWVKDDVRAIQKNGGDFPSAPGIYYIEVRQEGIDWNNVPGGYGPNNGDCPPPGSPDDSGPGGTGQSYGMCFYVDPLLSVIDQRPTMIDPTHYEVVAQKFHPGSLQVFEMPGNIPYFEGINYTADPDTGIITLTSPLPSGTSLSVDYYYAGDSIGPIPIADNTANNTAIPGVILAFGRRMFDGDVMAVVVTERRADAAREYGGRWEMSMDFDLLARDVYAQGEITDRTLMYLHTELRDRLSYEGIEITSASSGGEAEEAYDETGDEYFYTASISVTLETEWRIYLPLPGCLSRVIPNTVQQLQAVAGLSDEQIAETGSPTLLLIAENLGLVEIRDPYFRDRTQSYEMIR